MNTSLVDQVAPSNSRVKKAGSQIRKALRGDGPHNAEAFLAAIKILEQHRATFRTPLVSANNGLRSMVRVLQLEGVVSQRLKRMPTIINKLTREPTLALDRMHDIGGCRVVLPCHADIYSLAERLTSKRPVRSIHDYIKDPRESGYRGLHVVVEYGRRLPRPIEIQLRTEAMHLWATTVEDISANQGINYKMDGSSPMQEFLECYARLLEHQDLGTVPPPELFDEYATLLERAFGRGDDD